MAKPILVNSMVNMATALVISIHNTNMKNKIIKQADTLDGETTKAAIGKLILGNQNNIKEMIYRF